MLAQVKVEGVANTLNLLKSFDRETLKAVNKDIYQEVKPMVGEARSLVPDKAPMSGWAKPNNGEWGTRLLFQPQKVKMGIRTKIAPVRTRGTNIKERTIFLAQANAAGTVYEWAGRKSKGKTPAGQQFVSNIEERSGITVIGKQSRIMWKVVYDNRKRVTASVERIINSYMNRYNDKLAA